MNDPLTAYMHHMETACYTARAQRWPRHYGAKYIEYKNLTFKLKDVRVFRKNIFK